ncbi:prepilin-type N-terminal cleavage/methylation domain-containing protein [Patescibacteria group bacterium]|nr:prepilin-type N-terminal cleavage/methylation domain-containing protein [Patescibacteria group bacterium]
MKKGFTLFEALIAITIGVTLLALLLSIYSLSLRSLGDGQKRAELTQDSRITIERITRDIRETRHIATILPEDKDDPENPPPNEIELQDGHTDTLQYIRYYLSDTNLRRQIRQYYFETAPEILVPYDAEDDFGNPPELNIMSDHLAGKFIEDIDYFGSNPIYIELILETGLITHTTRTNVYGRNL